MLEPSPAKPLNKHKQPLPETAASCLQPARAACCSHRVTVRQASVYAWHAAMQEDVPAGVSITSIKNAVATLHCGKEWEAKLTLVPAPPAPPAAQERAKSEVPAPSAPLCMQYNNLDEAHIATELGHGQRSTAPDGLLASNSTCQDSQWTNSAALFRWVGWLLLPKETCRTR